MGQIRAKPGIEFQKPPSVFLCPSKTTHEAGVVMSSAHNELTVTNYVSNVQMFHNYFDKSSGNVQSGCNTHAKISSISDGLTNTVGFAERYAAAPNKGDVASTKRTAWLGTYPTIYDPVFAWDNYGEPMYNLPESVPAEEADPYTTQAYHSSARVHPIHLRSRVRVG